MASQPRVNIPRASVASSAHFVVMRAVSARVYLFGCPSWHHSPSHSISYHQTHWSRARSSSEARAPLWPANLTIGNGWPTTNTRPVNEASDPLHAEKCHDIRVTPYSTESIKGVVNQPASDFPAHLRNCASVILNIVSDKTKLVLAAGGLRPVFDGGFSLLNVLIWCRWKTIAPKTRTSFGAAAATNFVTLQWIIKDAVKASKIYWGSFEADT